MHVRRKLRLASTFAILAAATRLAFALDPQSPASGYRRTTFTTEDGLGANIISDILQARDGFLWIATYQGLTRFDGQHFTRVLPIKLNVNVHSMAEAPDGFFWLGTQTGVFRVSSKVWQSSNGSLSKRAPNKTGRTGILHGRPSRWTPTSIAR